MANFEFSLNNGAALIMPAGGSSACGKNFTAGKNDVVFQLTGEYLMNIGAGGNVSITLYNMHALIFPNKANYAGWLYYDTVWARGRGNCLHISLDVATVKQGHGVWSDANAYWHQQVTGWKGGTGIRGYDQWIKYRYDVVEPACAGEYVVSSCCNSPAGGYIGSAKAVPNQTFNLGPVDFATTKGFWIGANLDYSANGWEQWIYVPFPVVTFASPSVNVQTTYVDICDKVALANVTVTSTDPNAASGGQWELQYATDPNFSNAVTVTTTNYLSSASFSDLDIAPGVQYYIRARLKVSDTLYSSWGAAIYTADASIPKPSAVAYDITEKECHALMHGVLVTGGLINGV